MSLTATRHIRYYYELVDRHGQECGDLLGVRQGGSLTYSAAATVRSSGRIPVENLGQVESWVGVWIRVTAELSPTHTAPLGVFVPAVPRDDYSAAGKSWDVSLLDKLSVLAGDSFAAPYALPAGANVTSTVRSIIESTGLTPGAITESTATLRTAIEFEPDATKLQIINQMLEAAGFFSLWCDGLGQFQVTPYTAPQYRPVAFSFESGKNCIHSPTFQRTEDIDGIPNVVIAVSKSDPDTPALRAEAENNNPDSPYSIGRRGFRKTVRLDDVETTSQATLNQYAQRRLQELTSATATVMIQHAPIPLQLNDVVTFTSHLHGVSGRYVVQRIEWPLRFDGLVTTTLREVVDVG